MAIDLNGRCSVFVYGTLMKDFGNERVIANFPHENYSAKIEGVEMYDVGGFPALVKGEHSYLGELVVFDASVNPQALYSNMDMLEGYHANSPDNSLYLRLPVSIDVDGQQVETEVYLWNRDVSRLRYIDPEIYPSYREYVEEKRKVV